MDDILWHSSYDRMGNWASYPIAARIRQYCINMGLNPVDTSNCLLFCILPSAHVLEKEFRGICAILPQKVVASSSSPLPLAPPQLRDKLLDEFLLLFLLAGFAWIR
jgi:hypothetical protein